MVVGCAAMGRDVVERVVLGCSGCWGCEGGFEGGDGRGLAGSLGEAWEELGESLGGGGGGRSREGVLYVTLSGDFLLRFYGGSRMW